MTGNLRARSFPLLLGDLCRGRKSGILTVCRGEMKKQICLVQGLVRFAASNIRAESLGEYLRRESLVPSEALKRAESLIGAGKRLGAMLVEIGAKDMTGLRQAVRRHIVDILLPCFDWPDGTYEFTDGVPNIAGEIHVEIPILELMLERARHHENRALLSRLGFSRDARIDRLPDPANTVASVSLSPLETFIVSHADGHTSIGQVLSACGEGEEKALRSMQGLIDAGIVQVSLGSETRPATRASGAPTPGPRSGPVTDSDDTSVRRYLDLYRNSEGGDHYQVLGVPSTAKEEEIRRAYYQLARDVHPDRFASPPLSSIRAEMETLFARITDAYTTLGKASTREEYDRSRLLASPLTPPTSESTRSPAELARLNYRRGRTLAEQGKLAEALKFLNNAVALDKTRPEYLLLLGTLQARNPRMRSEALATLTTAAELNPTSAEARVVLGRLHRKLGNDVEAEKFFRDALRCDPDNAEARGELAGAKPAGGLLRGLFGRGESR